MQPRSHIYSAEHIAGALATLTLDLVEDDVIDKATVLTLVGVRYAGTEFVEAFIRKNTLPTSPATP